MAKSSTIDEMKQLRRLWKKITGDEMPPEISSLEIELVRRAVEHKKAKEDVFLPKEPVSRRKESTSGELIWWDTER